MIQTELKQTPFDYISQSPAYIKLNEEFDGGIYISEIIQIAQLLSSNLHIDLQKIDLKSITNLIQWFDKNWELIEPNLMLYNCTEFFSN
ncbi:hypothetical protein M9Y10_034636 [Tritrichomonas musculus]|uniref:Uncharacterized protein n=1 Tax=Tritrichomonas musculus TaxID=1915356 RepID=A0ABR2KFK5_9EUKA